VLSWVVSSRLHPYRAALPCRFRHRDEKPITVSPLDSALTDCDARNSFRIRSYENCRVSPSSPHKKPRSHLKFWFPICALCSLFSLFGPRVFHNSLAINQFHTLSRNRRGVPQLFPSWNSLAPLRSIPTRHLSHRPAPAQSGSLITSHLYRLTPLSSADSINLHPAERCFRRQAHPHGGIP